MATYIPGIQEYIPQVQPFKPDFNFFQSALEMKQAQYQAGYNKISSLYGQLLNSDLLRDPNKERRDTFFTEIDSEIKRLSGVDLSLAENQKEAMGLFQPLIDNNYFRKDLAYTKEYQNQLQRGKSYQNNPDPKSDERYWEEGITALHYKAEEFANSDDDSSLYFRNPEYTPYINGYEKLLGYAKEADFNPESVSFDGGYIIKTTNGVNAIAPLQNIFSGVLQSDPRYRKMFGVQSYLDRKNYMKSNAEKFNGDEYAAETEYLTNKAKDINAFYASLSKRDEDRLNQANTKKKVIEEKIQTEGVDPDLDPELVNLYKSLDTDTQVQTTAVEKDKEVTSQFENIDINTLDRDSLRNRVDNVMSIFLMDDLASKAARDYAMGKVKYDIKVDEYALENVKFAHQVSLQQMKQDHDKTMKKMDLAMGLLKENGYASLFDSANILESTGIVLPSGPGNITLSGMDQQKSNQAILSAIEDDGSKATLVALNQIVTEKNQILLSKTATDAEKAAARQAILDIAGGEYETEKQAAYKKEAPIDWSTGLLGVGQTIVGGLGVGLGAFFGLVTSPTVAGAAGGAAVATAGATLGAAGISNISKGFAGEEIEVPEQIIGTKGLVKKQADGTYKVIDPSEATHINNPNSDQYYYKTLQRVKKYADENLITAKQGTPAAKTKTIIDELYGKVEEQQLLKGLEQQTIKDNNSVILPALANESGVAMEDAQLFYSPDFSKIRSENEFIAAYYEANKNNEERYPRSQVGHEGFTYTIVGEERDEDIRDDAQDLYEELTDAYAELSTNPNAGLNIKAIGPKLANSVGINKWLSNVALHLVDSGHPIQQSNTLLADFYKKDWLPMQQDPTTRVRNGGRVVFGSGYTITADEYASEEYQHNPQAEATLNFLLAKTHTAGIHKSADRPIFYTAYTAVAANDGNKVAVTFDLDAKFINDNAGKADQKGPTWAMQQKMNANDGVPPKITFFMDANKAASAPFTQMQMTETELIESLQGYVNVDKYADYGGMVRLEKNAFGSYNLNGVGKAVDAAGKWVDVPFYDVVEGADINSLKDYWSEQFRVIQDNNLKTKEQMRANSTNKLFNPTQLLEQSN